MKVFRLQRTQRLPTSVAAAWAFFSDPRNLGRITPPSMRFEILAPLPDRVYPGLLVTYRVRPVGGLAVTWVTEITQVQEPWLFVDEQRVGPYRFWHHQHLFRAVPAGVEMEDIVHYALPFGPLGILINRLVVAPRLQEIFEFRRQALTDYFATNAEERTATSGESRPATRFDGPRSVRFTSREESGGMEGSSPAAT